MDGSPKHATAGEGADLQTDVIRIAALVRGCASRLGGDERSIRFQARAPRAFGARSGTVDQEARIGRCAIDDRAVAAPNRPRFSTAKHGSFERPRLRSPLSRVQPLPCTPAIVRVRSTRK